ncbi:hypothetical protein MLD38_037886 [Melastoma candidum]|uniref:Uncharacterized protein n=1 Tax=Melastoma candidum TaxID=119954 RepID=A0ACB9KYB7_9MYRT|nr:hypothetical protein MLD38_037886 [Melastoma candidum]
MTVTIPDVAFLMGCYLYGTLVRLLEVNDEFRFVKKQHLGTVIETHLSKDPKDWGEEEEYQFMIEWLSNYIYSNRCKQSQKHMVPVASFLVKATKRVALAPFPLSLVYRAHFKAVAIDPKNPGGFPSRPAEGTLWITAAWAHRYFPRLHNFELSKNSDPSIFYGLEIIRFFRYENWEWDTASGCLHRLLHADKPCWRPFPENDKVYELHAP